MADLPKTCGPGVTMMLAGKLKAASAENARLRAEAGAAYGRGVGDALSGDTWDELTRLRADVERLRSQRDNARRAAETWANGHTAAMPWLTREDGEG